MNLSTVFYSLYLEKVLGLSGSSIRTVYRGSIVTSFYPPMKSTVTEEEIEETEKGREGKTGTQEKEEFIISVSDSV